MRDAAPVKTWIELNFLQQLRFKVNKIQVYSAGLDLIHHNNNKNFHKNSPKNSPEMFVIDEFLCRIFTRILLRILLRCLLLMNLWIEEFNMNLPYKLN